MIFEWLCKVREYGHKVTFLGGRSAGNRPGLATEYMFNIRRDVVVALNGRQRDELKAHLASLPSVVGRANQSRPMDAQFKVSLRPVNRSEDYVFHVNCANVDPNFSHRAFVLFS